MCIRERADPRRDAGEGVPNLRIGGFRKLQVDEAPETLARLCETLGIEPYELFLPEDATRVAGEAPPPAYYDEVIEATRKAINTVKIRHGG